MMLFTDSIISIQSSDRQFKRQTEPTELLSSSLSGTVLALARPALKLRLSNWRDWLDLFELSCQPSKSFVQILLMTPELR